MRRTVVQGVGHNQLCPAEWDGETGHDTDKKRARREHYEKLRVSVAVLTWVQARGRVKGREEDADLRDPWIHS